MDLLGLKVSLEKRISYSAKKYPALVRPAISATPPFSTTVSPRPARISCRLSNVEAHRPRHGARERRLAKFRQKVARFRLYRLRFLQQNTRFTAFFKIRFYQIINLKFLKFRKKKYKFLRHLQNFAEFSQKFTIISC